MLPAISRLLAMIGLLCSCLALAAPDDWVVPARNHSAKSPNVMPVDPDYSDLVVCHGNNGMQQWVVELPAAGPYYLHAYYASGETRPLTLAINGVRQPGQCFAKNTGSFQKDGLAWESIGPLGLNAGKNTIEVTAAGYMPHLAGFVVSTDAKNWDRKAFAKLFRSEQEIQAERIAQEAPAAAATRERLVREFGIDKLLFIKRITYTASHYYTEFLDTQWTPGGNLCVLDLKTGAVQDLLPELATGVFGRFDLSFDAKKIVFDWKASPEHGYRIYEVNIDGTGLRQLTFPVANEDALKKKFRLEPLYHFGTDDMHPCYLPDGGIAFVSTRCQTSTLCHGGDAFTTTNLFRMDGDGKNLRQLSFSALSEFAPVLMEDGRILYARWEYVDKGAVSCKCLWSMRPDGSGSAEIYGADIDHPPTLIYGRPIPGAGNQFVVQGTPHYPMTGVGTLIKLDTTKNIRTREPMTYITPDVDIRAEGGFDFRKPDGTWERDGSGKKGKLYRDPYPLSGAAFLVSIKLPGYDFLHPSAYGLHLINDQGQDVPLYRDPAISCWEPMPLRPRQRPPVIATTPNLALKQQGLAGCIVTDVYHGMENVQCGTVKHLRVLAQIPRPWNARRTWVGDEYDQQHACITKDTHLALKVQLGVVPVEKDGSAYFLVPANQNIFLQALDENHVAVQTERTYVNYMPGEVRSCIGCHELPNDTPRSTATTLALRKPPAIPGPQPGETVGRRILDYRVDVQPVWDKHCVACHSGDKPKGNLNLSGEMTTLFSVSYENLVPERRAKPHNRDLVGTTIGENHPKNANVCYLPPRSLGSYTSVLATMLARGKIRLANPPAQARVERLQKLHEKIEITPAELLKVTNWLDTNCQFYGAYWGRRNLRYRGMPDFRPVYSFDQAISPEVPAEAQK
jgi:hypothetical protein